MMVYLAVVLITLIALAYVCCNYFKLRKMNEGTAEMVEIGGIIRNGARTFMRAEYRTIIPVIAIVAIIFSCFIEKTSGITFILGATMSSLACVIGMRSATYANVRTANTALETQNIGKTTQTALRGGSISGLSVPAFGLLGLIMVRIIAGGVDPEASGGGLIVSISCNPTIMRFTTYSLGCSLVAMFNRIAGGNYTKAADISADIVAKVRHDMPEDDSRMPNTIADFIGDNVNDIAGNCSDLLESFVATIVACILIAATFTGATAAFVLASSTFPIIIAGAGLLGSIIGIVYALAHKASDHPSKELDMATYISAGIVIIASFVASYVMFDDVKLADSFRIGWLSPFAASALGMFSGVMIGKITEYYTGTDYKPVKQLAEMATEGDAFVITKGDAIGSRSCLLPIGMICAALIISGLLCGIYGIALAALGMLSFVGTTVSIDAFGPIADNAGGIAESCHLDESIRAITDKLDAVGNTTAAIGKGFAIGSAAFATVSLIFAYVGSYASGTPTLNIAGYIVIAGAILGGAIIEYFSALLTDNTIESAKLMADEGDRQLSIPGVIEGAVKPDYEKCIDMAARQALKKMLVPSLLALLVPAIGGIMFGAEFVGGILVGATIVAIPKAIFMGNSGGAFDNGKKYIESGQLIHNGEIQKKGSDAHKAAVVGDTVGDTRKDVVGVALDIAIKLMSTVANTLAPVFASIHLFG